VRADKSSGKAAYMAGVILVHGFWADGSSWRGVIPSLVAAGHEPIAVQLPLSTFADDVATVRRAAERISGPLVLAGHSYGDVVISEAAVGTAGVSALAYVSAYAPEFGRTSTRSMRASRRPPAALRSGPPRTATCGLTSAATGTRSATTSTRRRPP
jgi:pimeloyl-ACP methyl ester carboxylesterase